MSHADLTIVGAGLAGLTAAVLAARAGLSVTLWTGREAGGRARTDVVDGFHLNHGAHALYDAGVAARTWRELGLDLRPRACVISQMFHAVRDICLQGLLPHQHAIAAILRHRRDSAKHLASATARVEARGLRAARRERPDRLRSRTRGCGSTFSDVSRRRLA